ncbi:MAG: hypothetical protein HRJ53_10205, partial [Acidobacteria bacterium Pan2503]|nr:hypothetical protein [Candidatus Acidoferrum panamensis]
EKRKEEEKSKKKERESPDFTVELVTSDGAAADVPVSKFLAIPPPFKERFTKLSIIDEKAYEKEWEPVFQTVRIPLAEFQPPNGAKQFAPGKLSAIKLKFDRIAMSVICISGIGFGRR